MFNASNADDAPQPPKVLATPLEISGNLRMLQDSHDPLIITFHERSQRFQSYLVDVDRERNALALDEMIPGTANASCWRASRFVSRVSMMACASRGKATAL